MIFIFLLIFCFISCHAMEEIKPFHFLKLPPELQNLVLSFVDIHNKYINWESETTLKRVLQNKKQCIRHDSFPKKIQEKFREISGHNGYSHSYFLKNIDDLPSLCLPFTSRFAVSPDNSKIAALGFETAQVLHLGIVDLKSETFTIKPWIKNNNYLFNSVEAIAISSNGNMVSYLIRGTNNYVLKVENKQTQEQKEFIINFFNSSNKPKEGIARDAQLHNNIFLTFNMQGTQIGAYIRDEVLNKETIALYCLDNNPRMKFLKQLCKDPEKQISRGNS